MVNNTKGKDASLGQALQGFGRSNDSFCIALPCIFLQKQEEWLHVTFQHMCHAPRLMSGEQHAVCSVFTDMVR